MQWQQSESGFEQLLIQLLIKGLIKSVVLRSRGERLRRSGMQDITFPSAPVRRATDVYVHLLPASLQPQQQVTSPPTILSPPLSGPFPDLPSYIQYKCLCKLTLNNTFYRVLLNLAFEF